jgi:hypothetical protein
MVEWTTQWEEFGNELWGYFDKALRRYNTSRKVTE